MAKWTAADWDRSQSAEKMLTSAPPLRRRKLRLYSCVLCNRFRQHIASRACLAALAAAEQDADKPLNKDDLRAIRIEAEGAAGRLFITTASSQENVIAIAARAFAYAIGSKPRIAALATSRLIVSAAGWQAVGVKPSDEVWEAATRAEHRLQADLLSHIVGNPFRPFPAPPPLPTAVVQLAAALEAGESVAFALRDALLEAGQTELAEHFAGEEPHPRGCWAVDLLLGKE